MSPNGVRNREIVQWVIDRVLQAHAERALGEITIPEDWQSDLQMELWPCGGES